MIHPYNTLIELINKTLIYIYIYIYIFCWCLIPLPHSELYRLGDGGVAQRSLLWCAWQWSSSVVVTQPCWSWGAGVWIGWRDIRSLMQPFFLYTQQQKKNIININNQFKLRLKCKTDPLTFFRFHLSPLTLLSFISVL